jgi:taurine dioxygenase
MSRAPLVLHRVTPSIGAVVEGLQLANVREADLVEAIRAALVEHQVLFFRDQQLDPRQHRDFAARFGELHIHPIYAAHSDAPEIIVMDTDTTDLKDNSIWHTDVTFSPTPPLGGVLAARIVPPYGGDTLWCSCGAAYEALSPPLQRMLEGLTATHDIARSFPEERYALTAAGRARLEQAKANNPPVTHPVIRTHPVSGRKGIFVQPGFTARINELSQPENRALLGFLYAHTTQPEFVVRWKWRPGDVAFWDNRLTQHYVTDDYGAARRVMHRATILGDRPV